MSLLTPPDPRSIPSTIGTVGAGAAAAQKQAYRLMTSGLRLLWDGPACDLGRFFNSRHLLLAVPTLNPSKHHAFPTVREFLPA